MEKEIPLDELCFNTQERDDMYTFCTEYGKLPVQARGAWVTRPIDNWVKAATLLKKHQQSEWHLSAVEKYALFQLSQEHGDVVDLIISASEQDKKDNRELIKKLIRSLYFLVKHHIPHTTTFEDLVTLQIENGDLKLKRHRETTPQNATYESYTTVVELITSISRILENRLLQSLNDSPYYSLMADESKSSQCVHVGLRITNQWNIFLVSYQLRRPMHKPLPNIYVSS